MIWLNKSTSFGEIKYEYKILFSHLCTNYFTSLQSNDFNIISSVKFIEYDILNNIKYMLKIMWTTINIEVMI